MIQAIFGLPAIYVVTRVIWPLPWPLAVRIAVSLAVLAASQFHFWNKLSSGSIFDPKFPRSAVVVFNWAIGVIAMLCVTHLVIEVVILLRHLLPGEPWAIRTAWRYGVGAVAMGLSAYAVGQAIRVPPLVDVELPVRGLPREFDGYRILQLTDLHISRLFPAS